MSARWRCGVCEGVNDGGRTCATCGAVITRTASLAASARAELERPPVRAVRERLPEPVRRRVTGPTSDRSRSAPRYPRRSRWTVPAPPPVPSLDYGDALSGDPYAEVESGVDVRPLPGGCLVSVGPKRRRRTW